MEQKVIGKIYDLWTENEKYNVQSALENEIFDQNTTAIKKIIGENTYREISDEIMNIGCEAEIAGFENGVRYGIMFMSDIFKTMY